MNNPSQDANPVHLVSSIGDEALDKSKNVSIASTSMHPSNTGNSQNSADVFEQAKMNFFSK